jgi:hypothetical protein
VEMEELELNEFVLEHELSAVRCECASPYSTDDAAIPFAYNIASSYI